MLWIYQFTQMFFVFFFKLCYLFGLLILLLRMPDLLNVVAHLFKDLRILKGPYILKAFDYAILFTRHIAKEFPTIDNLLHRLIERDGHPPILPAPARALKDAAYTVWII